ncbi:hypothetical protein AB0910_14565 [Streptomyces sp. NPDC047002]
MVTEGAEGSRDPYGEWTRAAAPAADAKAAAGLGGALRAVQAR